MSVTVLLLRSRAYGSVYRSVHKASGFLVAIKLVPCTNAQGTDIEKEIEVLKKCRDPNIVSYFGCCIKDKNLWVCRFIVPNNDARFLWSFVGVAL